MKAAMETQRSGFSLLEMVIALAILAVATTIAIRATSGLQDQSRYQATIGTLNNVQSAILGPLNQRNPDGTPLVTGFLADVGRLPNYVAGADPLAELTTNPNNIRSYGPATSSFDATITVFSGWQGPYIRLPIGATAIHDGWGNVLHLYDSSLSPIPPSSNTVGLITSWCADNQADPAFGGQGGTTGYSADASLVIPSSGLGSPTASLTGYVKMLDSSGNPTTPNTTSSTTPVTIWICYFGPDGNGGVQQIPIPVAPPTTLGALWQYTLTGATPGSRVLKAYVVPSTYTPFNSAAVTNAIKVSQTLSITAIGGGQRVSDLILPYYAP